MLLIVPILAIFCYKVFPSDGGCKLKSSGALSIEVVDFGLGTVARWVHVEVMDVRGPMDKYWSNIGCEISLMRVDVGREGP
jgi:hypothetical protein